MWIITWNKCTKHFREMKDEYDCYKNNQMNMGQYACFTPSQDIHAIKIVKALRSPVARKATVLARLFS